MSNEELRVKIESLASIIADLTCMIDVSNCRPDIKQDLEQRLIRMHREAFDISIGKYR